MPLLFGLLAMLFYVLSMVPAMAITLLLGFVFEIGFWIALFAARNDAS